MILLWLSIAFLSGILVGSWAGVLGLVMLVPVCVFVVTAWAARHKRWWPAPLILAAFLLGIIRAPHDSAPSPADLAYYNGMYVQMQGIVSAEPDIRDTGANYVVSVSQVIVKGKTIHVSGQVQIHTSAATQLEYGDGASLAGTLLAPVNSSSLPWRDILARRGIGSEMRFPRLSDQGPSATGPAAWIQQLRQRLERGINRWLPEPEAALLIAITLGAKTASLGDLAPPLVSTGLIHLIAISGIKVALIAGTVNQVVRLSRSRWLTLAASLSAIWLYVVLTGVTASGTRSAVMWTLVFIAAPLGRGTVPLVSLGFAAAVMSGFDPGLLWDVGFQLSVVATLSIVMFAPRLTRVLHPLPSPWRETLAVTVPAQMSTVPLVAIGFHLVSSTGPLANLVVLPLLPLLIVVGFMLGVVSGLPVFASPLAAFAYVLLHAISSAAESISSWGGVLPTPVVTPLFVFSYFALLGALAFAALRFLNQPPTSQWTGRGREFGFAGVLGASLLTLSLAHGQPDSRARLSWLGSGDSMLLQSMGQSALIDGSSHPFALLERLGALLPYDRRKIDIMIVTDPRGSNVQGMISILDHYTVGAVLDVGAEYPSSTYSRWRALLRANRIPVYALRTGARIRVGNTDVVSEGPDDLYPDPKDSIGLLRISLPDTTVLVLGSASVREQHEAVFRPVNIRAAVLISSGPLDPAFLHAVRPASVRVVGKGTGTMEIS